MWDEGTMNTGLWLQSKYLKRMLSIFLHIRLFGWWPNKEKCYCTRKIEERANEGRYAYRSGESVGK